jgi:hypothetical protein
MDHFERLRQICEDLELDFVLDEPKGHLQVFNPRRKKSRRSCGLAPIPEHQDRRVALDQAAAALAVVSRAFRAQLV